MWKTAFTEEQSAYALRQAESGTPILEICRKLGISEQTFLPLEEEICRDGHGRTAPLTPTGGRESATQTTRADLALDRRMLQEVIRRKL